MLNLTQTQSPINIQTHPTKSSQPSQLSLQFFSQVPQLNLIQQPFKLNTIDHQLTVRDFDNQFELIRTITETKKHKLRLRTNNVLENKKNRYPQQSIYDHSRILVHQNMIKIVTNNVQDKEKESPKIKKKNNINAYINANQIYKSIIPSVISTLTPTNPTHPSSKITQQYSQIFITQAPLKQTLIDFLTLIIQNQINCVVMLCNVIQNGKNKCYDYLNQAYLYDSIQLIENNKYVNTQVQIRKIRIKIQKIPQPQPQKQQKQDEMLLQQSKNIKNYHEFYHILYTGWPDKNVPENPSHIDPIIEQMIKYNKILIHCSAGLGRSGVVAVLYRVLREVNYYDQDLCKQNENQVKKIGEGKLSVFRAVREIRQDRFGAVQNNQQYKFIYQYLQYFYHRLLKKGINEWEEMRKIQEEILNIL